MMRWFSKTLLALDSDCECHWLVVAHDSGSRVRMMAVMVVVDIPSFTTSFNVMTIM